VTQALQLPIRKTKRNAPARVVSLPECLICKSSVYYFERDGKLRRFGRHCLRCHSRNHNSCAACDACLPERVRSDRATCSSKCRQQAHRWRHYRETKIEFQGG
jgi:hypothetical protein